MLAQQQNQYANLLAFQQATQQQNALAQYQAMQQASTACSYSSPIGGLFGQASIPWCTTASLRTERESSEPWGERLPDFLKEVREPWFTADRFFESKLVNSTWVILGFALIIAGILKIAGVI